MLVDTPTVVTVNVAVVAPAAIVTEAGTVALVLLDVSVTTRPFVGAGPLMVAVPVEDVPPTTDVGETAMLVRVGTVMVRVAVLDVPANVPVIVTEVLVDTAVVVIANVALLDPAATVTVAGRVALVLLELSATTLPPGPAGPVRVAVPVEPVPPMTDVGLTETLDSVAGVIVSVAV